MPRLLRNNGLTIVMTLFFIACLFGQVLAGHREHNHDQMDHGQPPIGFAAYLGSSHFLEATMENWESEFLQCSPSSRSRLFFIRRGPQSRRILNKKIHTINIPAKSE